VLTPEEELWETVAYFIDEHKISCAEVIAQNDRVIEGAYDFIEKLCDLVGYHEGED
jgi:hypothetical protein